MSAYPVYLLNKMKCARKKDEENSRSERWIRETSDEETILCLWGLFNLCHFHRYAQNAKMMYIYAQHIPHSIASISMWDCWLFTEMKNVHFSPHTPTNHLSINASSFCFFFFFFSIIDSLNAGHVTSNRTPKRLSLPSVWTFRKRQAQIPSMSFEGVCVYCVVCSSVECQWQDEAARVHTVQ